MNTRVCRRNEYLPHLHAAVSCGTGTETVLELAGETPTLRQQRVAFMPEPDKKLRLVAGLHSRGGLPHLKREGGTYFVCFRQSGTFPKAVVIRFKQEREAILEQAKAAKRPLTWHEQEELFRWYANRVDKYLDAGHGTCYLRQPEFAQIVAGAICFFDGQRYALNAWVVMPNHVHVVVRPLPNHTLSDILHSWKSYTAHKINQQLPKPVLSFWQNESYEHLVRDAEDLHRCCEYTLLNPVNAGLCSRLEDWPWSSHGPQANGVTPPNQ